MSTLKRSLLAALASAALLGVTFVPVPAAHATNIIDVATESELVTALTTAAQTGDSVRLLEDIGTSTARVSAFTISKNLTLDLNGHNLFAHVITLLENSEIDFMIDDRSASGDGVIDLYDQGADIAAGIAIEVKGAHLTIAGGTVRAKASTSLTAAIGGHTHPSPTVQRNEDILITGGTVIAEAIGGAAIGATHNEVVRTAYTVRITGGNVTATSIDGAGIGSSYQSRTQPTVFIEGGVVTAQSTTGAAIGSGKYAEGIPTIVIEGGSVTAESVDGAGLGGGSAERDGYPVTAGPVTITGDATVKATSTNAAGIGGGIGGNATSTFIGEGADVTAFSYSAATPGAPAIGAGPGAPVVGDWPFFDGPLTVEGTLHIPAGTFVRSTVAVPAGSVVNTIGETGIITGGGEMRARGVWNNFGAVTLANAGIKAKDINANHFNVSFDVGGVGTQPADIRVFAPTFTLGDRNLPTLPPTGGWVFAGWNTVADGTGTTFTADTKMTPLPELSGVDGTVVRLYAQWLPSSITVEATPATQIAGSTIMLTGRCLATANEDLGDCTNQIVFSSNVASDVITGNTVKVTQAGPRTFTGTLADLTAEATADVIAGPAVSLQLSSSADAVIAGESLPFTTTVVDAYGNTTDVTFDARINSDQTDDAISGNNITFASPGTSAITSTWGTLRASLTIDVTAAPSLPSTSTPNATEATSTPRTLPTTGAKNLFALGYATALLLLGAACVARTLRTRNRR